MSVNVNKVLREMGEKNASVFINFIEKYGCWSKGDMEKVIGGPLSEIQLEFIDFCQALQSKMAEKSDSESSEDEQSDSKLYNQSKLDRGRFKENIQNSNRINTKASKKDYSQSSRFDPDILSISIQHYNRQASTSGKCSSRSRSRQELRRPRQYQNRKRLIRDGLSTHQIKQCVHLTEDCDRSRLSDQRKRHYRHQSSRERLYKPQNKRYVTIRHSSTSEDSLSRSRSRENISQYHHKTYRDRLSAQQNKQGVNHREHYYRSRLREKRQQHYRHQSSR